MASIIRVASGHTMYVEKIAKEDLPEHLQSTNDFTDFYVVKNFDKGGHVFLYLGKGNSMSPKQICAWYPRTGAFWSSYGTTLLTAIEGAQQDGWKYA